MPAASALIDRGPSPDGCRTEITIGNTLGGRSNRRRNELGEPTNLVVQTKLIVRRMCHTARAAFRDLVQARKPQNDVTTFRHGKQAWYASSAELEA